MNQRAENHDDPGAGHSQSHGRRYDTSLHDPIHPPKKNASKKKPENEAWVDSILTVVQMRQESLKRDSSRFSGSQDPYPIPQLLGVVGGSWLNPSVNGPQ